MTKLLILCGGRSAEQDVSRISAANVLRHVDRRRYRPLLVHIDGRGRWILEKAPQAFAFSAHPERHRFSGPELSVLPGANPWLKAGARPVAVDAVFPVLHGPMGEDGAMQGLLEIVGVPYVGCDVYGSAACMDKEMTKLIAERSGLPVLAWGALHDPTAAPDLARRVGGYPVFVKPARMGSSVGVSKARRASELAPAARLALRYDDKFIIEKGIAAREIECAVLGDPFEKAGRPRALRTSVLGETRPKREFLDYTSKYLDPAAAEVLVPAPLTKAQESAVREMAERAFRCLGCYGMGRVDFLMDKSTGKIWFNEINAIPGFTPASYYPMLWKAAGLPFPALIDRLVALAFARRKARASLSVSR